MPRRIKWLDELQNMEEPSYILLQQQATCDSISRISDSSNDE
jgi:hypothetical protein